MSKGKREEWSRALETIELLVNLGVPPSDRGLRDILWPQRERLLAERKGSRNVALVVRELARVQQALEAAPITDDPEDERDEALIRQATDLLRGTVVVFIGGDERPPVAQTIVDAFELRELVWCDTRPHKSHFPLEPAIARADVSVMLLAIRWASHGLGEVRTFCERYDKAFVRLPAGYSVNQLAFQILQQASDRLG